MPVLSIGSRLKHAWNAFFNKDPTFSTDVGASYYYKPDRFRYSRGNERSIVTSIYNRIALDTAAVTIKHVQLDEGGRYLTDIDSGLNRCLTVEANLDQAGRLFRQDIVQSMLDEGCIAICPIDTDSDPSKTDSYDILSMRVGKIVQWYPQHVKVDVYNENNGRREELLFGKRKVAIVENPLYAVVNEPNSTMQRLIRKLNILDAIDEKNGSGKLDLIISFPHVINTERAQTRADNRKKEIERQLANSKYGIVYTDGTEHITQLNRPIENNLLNQIEYLQGLLYSQLGLTKEIMDGSADDAAMQNYYSRTIEPILGAIAEELERKFITKNARTRGHAIRFFRNQFKFVTVMQIGNVIDKLITTRIVTPNEIREIIGFRPSEDPMADTLSNPNVDTKDSVVSEGAEGVEGAENNYGVSQNLLLSDIIKEELQNEKT